MLGHLGVFLFKFTSLATEVTSAWPPLSFQVQRPRKMFHSYANLDNLSIWFVKDMIGLEISVWKDFGITVPLSRKFLHQWYGATFQLEHETNNIWYKETNMKHLIRIYVVIGFLTQLSELDH